MAEISTPITALLFPPFLIPVLKIVYLTSSLEINYSEPVYHKQTLSHCLQWKYLLVHLFV